MIACPNCSTALNDGSKFCPSCGTAIEPAKVEVAAEISVVCTKCGAALTPEDKFCQTCGAPVVVATVIQDTAAAQPVTPIHTPVGPVAAASQTSAPATAYPLSTPQGYRCPTCQAFLQPGSGFCAACGTRFVQPVPYGGGAARTGMNPAIPITIAVIVLGGAAFGGWWFFGRGKNTTVVTTTGGTPAVTTTTGGGLTGGTETSDAEAAKSQAVALFTTLYKDRNASALYRLFATGPAFHKEFADEAAFVAAMAKMPPEMILVGNAISNIQAGEPAMNGTDRADVPISFTLTKPSGETVAGQANAQLVKRDGTWKLDLTGENDADIERVMTSAMAADFLQSMAATMTSPSTTGGTAGPTSTTGSTGEFDATSGTSGMTTGGTTGGTTDDF